MASVQIQNVGKSFGTTEILRNVDVRMEDGEFVVFIGPSGCGKSTLLRLISGLERVTSGEILIGDRPVNHLPAKERDIAMVFQNYALYPHMNVRDNMAFSMKMQRAPQADVEQRLAKAASILGLEPLMQRYPRELSGGQRQRVAMGRAIVRDPKVFLFDEPLSNLDAKLRVQMRGEIKALHRRLGTTMAYVTHDQIEAMTMADRIVIMRNGAVEQAGPPLELYDRPCNTFVATFIGSPAMNLIEGTVSQNGAMLADGGLVLPLPDFAKGMHGQRVVYGIRPEDLLLGEGEIVATLVSSEATGSETHLALSASGVDLLSVAHARIRIAIGERVHVGVEPSRVHLFHASTGERLRLG